MSAYPEGSRESDIFPVVREILVDILGVDPDQVTPTARICEDLGGDSLVLPELVERNLNLTIPDDAAEGFRTADDVVRELIRLSPH